MNERGVIRAIWNTPNLPRSDLADRLGLTQQSVHRIVDTLGRRGIVRLGPPVPGTGRGKPSPTLTLNPDWAVSIGISLNTDRAGVTIMKLSGACLTRAVDIGGLDRAAGLKRIDSTIATLLDEQGVSRDDVLGVGFGIAGYRVSETGFNPPEPLGDWALIELGPILSAHFGCPVWPDNGANCAALAEAATGIGLTTPNFAYLSFDYGFGGAIITDGRLSTGACGNAGEFSGMFDADDSLRRPALGLLIEELAARGHSVGSLAELKRNFRMDWPGATEWVAKVMPQFNRIINALSAIVDPEVIVLGGEIPLPLAQAFVEKSEFWSGSRHGVARPTPRLQVSELRDEPSSIGSAMLPIAACLL